MFSNFSKLMLRLINIAGIINKFSKPKAREIKSAAEGATGGKMYSAINDNKNPKKGTIQSRRDIFPDFKCGLYNKLTTHKNRKQNAVIAKESVLILRVRYTT